MDSILNQTYQNFEIIMVDDGSKDNCPAICDNYATLDSRIRVIHKKNAGLGKARNSGLELASGDYILFVDSDDYLAPNALQTIMDKLLHTGADACLFNFACVDDSGKLDICKAPLDKELYKQPEINNTVLLGMVGAPVEHPSDNYISMSVWKYAYSRKFLMDNYLLFPSEREVVSEDIVFHLNAMPLMKSLCVSPEVLYYYCKNSAYLSLTKKYDENKFIKYKNLYVLQVSLIEKLDLASEGTLRAQRRFVGNTKVCIKHILNNQEFTLLNKIKKIHQICNDDLFKQVTKQYPYKRMKMKQRILFAILKNL